MQEPKRLSSSGTPQARTPWLDIQRGLAVLFMIEVHLLDGWLVPRPPGPPGLAVDTLRFIGGLAAPGFLYLAGYAACMGARATRAERIKRGFYVLGIAYAFRAGEYLLGAAFWVPYGYLGIIQVDILNVIGVSLILLGAVYTPERWRQGLIYLALATAAVVLMPVVAHGGQPLLGGYLYQPSGFSLLNWGAFAFAGAILAIVKPSVWVFGMAGVALVLGGLGLDLLPPFFAHQNFWHTSPAWFLVRLGATVLISFVAWQAALLLGNRAWSRPLTSFLALVGRHSLMGYMVSVELTYGLLLRRFHHAVDVVGFALAVVGMTALVGLLAFASERKGAWLARLKAR